MHHHLHQEVPDPVTEQLHTPGHNPVDSSQDEDTVPHPEDGEHLDIIISIIIIILSLNMVIITDTYHHYGHLVIDHVE